MTRKSTLLAVVCLFLLISAVAVSQDSAENISVTIIYDNYDLKDSPMQEDWGFAAVIKGFGKLVLFDTGTKGDLFMGNLAKSEYKAEDIEVLILSHQHYDHIGGLAKFLEKNNKVKIYIPASFNQQVKQLIKKSGAEFTEVTGKREILPGLYTTGEMGDRIIEQSVYFDCAKGRGIVTGCAHPGIENIVAFVHKATGKPVGTVIGGFHLMSASSERLEGIKKTLDDSGMTRLLATHCSGDPARSYFKKIYGDRFIDKGLSETVVIRQ